MPRTPLTRKPLTVVCCVLAVLIPGAYVVAQPDGPAQAVQGIALILLVPVAILAKSAVQAVIAVLFPGWTARARSAAEEQRGLCLAWGALLCVLTFLVLLITGGVLNALAPLGLVFLLVVALLANWGFVGPASLMGERLLPGTDRTPLQALTGALVLSFACLMPIIGWALLLLLLFASLGAGLMALSRRATPRAATAPAKASPASSGRGPEPPAGETF